MKKLVLAFCAAVLALGLAACSGGTSSSSASGSADSAASSGSGSSAEVASSGSAASSSASSDATDFDWVAFEVPDGWAEHSADFSEVSIRQDGSTDIEIKVSPQSTVTAGGDAEAAAAKRATQSDGNTAGDAFQAGGRTWYPVYFTFGGEKSAYLYTDISDDHVAYVTSYTLTEADEPVQTVLESITFNEDAIV